MITCSKCGNKCKDGSKFCTVCSNKIGQNMQNNNVKKGEKFITNTNLLLAEGEINVKSYHCTTFSKGFWARIFSLASDGYLSVTNKRVIFYGDGVGQSSLVCEVPLQSVQGVNSYTGKGRNLGAMIVGIILSLIIGLSLFNSGKYDDNIIYMLLGIVVLFGGIFVAIKGCRYTNYTLAIQADGSNSYPISIGDKTFGRGLTGQGAINSMDTFPTGQSEILRRELGALILDLQTMGSLAIDKWKNGKSVSNMDLKSYEENQSKQNIDLTKNNVNSRANDSKKVNNKSINSSNNDGDIFNVS